LEIAKEEAPAKQAAKKAAEPEEKNILETIVDNPIAKSMMRTAGNTIVRSLLGSLGLGGTSRKKKSSWF
ncbi:MAG TPA: ATPase, partial [Flavipsychrobacter sp.]